MRVQYEFATTDHVPFSILVNVDNLPTLSSVDNNICTEKIDWSNLMEDELRLQPPVQHLVREPCFT